MCAVWRKSRSFTQGEFSHFPSSHFVQFICAQCGGSGEVGAPGWLSNDCQATQTTGFPGPFRIPSNNFVLTFYPPSFLLYILNIKSKHLATKVSQDGILLWFKQWPKGLPGRRRLQHHQVAIYMCHILYVFAYVTLIKSTHSLAWNPKVSVRRIIDHFIGCAIASFHRHCFISPLQKDERVRSAG